MTQFKAPLYIGDPDTGAPSTNNRGWAVATQEVLITNTARKAQFQIPDNSSFLGLDVVMVSGAASTQGTSFRIGTSAAPTAYATISASAEGQVLGTLNRAVVSAGTIIAIDATASVAASSADNIGRAIVRALYFTRS